MKTFDLMFCCLGNGITICDRSRCSGGDYKNVAHIAEWGGLKLYDQRLMGTPALDRIMDHAMRTQENARIEWFNLPYWTQYSRWYESMTLHQQLNTRDYWPKEKSAEWLYGEYIANMNRIHGHRMAQEIASQE